jgi:hypothetical protein
MSENGDCDLIKSIAPIEYSISKHYPAWGWLSPDDRYDTASSAEFVTAQ